MTKLIITVILILSFSSIFANDYRIDFNPCTTFLDTNSVPATTDIQEKCGWQIFNTATHDHIIRVFAQASLEFKIEIYNKDRILIDTKLIKSEKRFIIRPNQLIVIYATKFGGNPTLYNDTYLLIHEDDNQKNTILDLTRPIYYRSHLLAGLIEENSNTLIITPDDNTILKNLLHNVILILQREQQQETIPIEEITSLIERLTEIKNSIAPYLTNFLLLSLLTENIKKLTAIKERGAPPLPPTLPLNKIIYDVQDYLIKLQQEFERLKRNPLDPNESKMIKIKFFMIDIFPSIQKKLVLLKAALLQPNEDGTQPQGRKYPLQKIMLGISKTVALVEKESIQSHTFFDEGLNLLEELKETLSELAMRFPYHGEPPSAAPPAATATEINSEPHIEPPSAAPPAANGDVNFGLPPPSPPPMPTSYDEDTIESERRHCVLSQTIMYNLETMRSNPNNQTLLADIESNFKDICQLSTNVEILLQIITKISEVKNSLPKNLFQNHDKLSSLIELGFRKIHILNKKAAIPGLRKDADK